MIRVTEVTLYVDLWGTVHMDDIQTKHTGRKIVVLVNTTNHADAVRTAIDTTYHGAEVLRTSTKVIYVLEPIQC